MSEPGALRICPMLCSAERSPRPSRGSTAPLGWGILLQLTIQEIYVPVKRRQTLDPKKVEALAESMLAQGQDAPVVGRPDSKHFVLVEGLHRLGACKALGETTLSAYLVQPRQH